MGRKVFVTYKYSDTQVQDLNVYEDSFYFGRHKVQTKARHYVDSLSEILEGDDHIYKGEDDGESLADFADGYIATKLKGKIFDSTITIVLVSKGMKNFGEPEKDQWMPWEISYSLKELTRNDRTSTPNAVLAVVLPDEYGSYDYYITHNPICNCRTLNTPFLFEILRCNMFNEKKPRTETCSNGSIVYYGDYSYIQSVKWVDFKTSHNFYLDKAIAIRDKMDNYNLTKKAEQKHYE